MSKYFDKNFSREIGKDISGTEIYQPNIDDAFINLIFSNITSGNIGYLYEKINSDIKLNFTDENNNSVVHILLNVDSKLLTEDIKLNILRFFINHNAPLNTYNNQKLTPLHIAILKGDAEIVKFLIDSRVNINATTNNNLTALFLALKNNINICPDLIIPRELNKDEKKDDNKLKKYLQTDIKNIFKNNPNYNNYFSRYLKQIFIDFIKGRNYKKDIVNGIIKKYQNSLTKPDNSAQNIQNKFESELNESIESLKNQFEINDQFFKEDFDFVNYTTIEDEERIKRDINKKEEEIVQMYNEKVNNLRILITNINLYIRKYFNFFQYELFLLSRIEKNGDLHNIFVVDTDRITVCEYDDPPAATTCRIIGLFNGAFPAFPAPPVPVSPNYYPESPFPNPNPAPNNLPDANFSFRRYDRNEIKLIEYLIDNYILLQGYNLDIKNKFIEHKRILRSLFTLKSFLDNINENSFVLPVPPNLIISYKFILLNYFKICELINNIDLIFNTFNQIRPFQEIDILLRPFLRNRMNFSVGAISARNPPPIPPNDPPPLVLPFAPFTAFGGALPHHYYQDKISDIVGNFNYPANPFAYFLNYLELFNIDLNDTPEINLTNSKNCNQDQLVERLNTINKNKYSLKFIDNLNQVIPGYPKNRIFYDNKYFNTLITANDKNNFIQDFKIKYKGAGNITIFRNPYQIFSIDDDLGNQEYNRDSKDDSKFKLYSENLYDGIQRIIIAVKNILRPLVAPAGIPQPAPHAAYTLTPYLITYYFEYILMNAPPFNLISIDPAAAAVIQPILDGVAGPLGVAAVAAINAAFAPPTPLIIQAQQNQIIRAIRYRIRYALNELPFGTPFNIAKNAAIDSLDTNEILQILNVRPEYINGTNYIKRDDVNCELLTMNKEPVTILKKKLIKEIIGPIGTIDPIGDTYKNLIKKYNPGNIDRENFKSIFISYINEFIDEYIDSAKINFARDILKEKFDINNLSLYDNIFNMQNIKDSTSTILAVDYRNSSDDYINEVDKTKDQYFYYNYNSQDEKLLCYNNNIQIIKKLLDNSQTNYFDTDKEGNNILHYLVNIENYLFFKDIYNKYKNKLQKFKNTKNKYNKSPLDVLNNKIHKNNINFYIIKDKKANEDKLLFSTIFSSDLFTKLKNNNEISGLIPKFIKDIFDDLFLIYNLGKESNIDIFSTSIGNIQGQSYYVLFQNLGNNKKKINYNNNINKWDIRDTSNENLNINNELYQFIQMKHNIKKKISENKYIMRFWNSIAHIITLHFTTKFYDMIYDLISQNYDQLIETSVPITRNAPSTNEILKEFRDSIFIFDPLYVKRNLGQEIVIYLYKIKYNSEIKEDKQFVDLNQILKHKLNKIINLNSKSRKLIYDQQIEKIILNLAALFDLFRTKIIIFLNSYIKFIELQYNLQSIRDNL